MNYIRNIIVALTLIALPLASHAITKPWYQVQLELEEFNLSHYGNPFGPTGKAGELYDLVTGLPWWRIQLDKEALYMELYGNPCGINGCNTIKPPTIAPNAQPMPNDIKEIELVPEAKIEPLVINTEMWKQWKTGGNADHETLSTYFIYQGTWGTEDIGSIRCVTPDYPDGVLYDQKLTSGKIGELDISHWKNGDQAVCTWKVGDVTKETAFTK